MPNNISFGDEDSRGAREPATGSTRTKSKNARNGCYERQVLTREGKMALKMPRDRNGQFNSKVVPKGTNDICGLQAKILNLADQGNDFRGIAAIINGMLDVDVSHEYVRLVIESNQERLKAWQERRLDAVYPFVFIDFRYVNARNEKGRALARPVYVILGIDTEGMKELLSVRQ